MQCFHPLYIRGPDYTGPVPCGKCFACQSNKRKDWFMRVKYEHLSSVCSYTVTLTYDDEHLPVKVLFSKKDPLNCSPEEFEQSRFWYHPFVYEHVQLFFKRLRKMGYQFRYFGVAEYGAYRGRPHYHIIFFFNYYVDRIYFLRDVRRQWPYGCQIVIDPTTDDCIGYTLKYCLKPFTSTDPDPRIFLSKRPFIGHGYLSDTTVNYLRTHVGDVVSTMAGKVRLPRHLRNKVYDDDMKEANLFELRSWLEQKQFDDMKKADDLGITYEELLSRRRKSFTNSCLKAIKKKKL